VQTQIPFGDDEQNLCRYEALRDDAAAGDDPVLLIESVLTSNYATSGVWLFASVHQGFVDIGEAEGLDRIC